MIFLFQTGSQLYGLTNERSDHDFLAIIVGDTKYPFPDDKDIEVWTLTEFKEKLQEHDLKALEVYYSNTYLINQLSITLEFDSEKLRRSVSAVVSNAYVKAKKKIRDGDVYTGLKSYWHCIRILDFYHDFNHSFPDNPKNKSKELRSIYEGILAFENKYPLEEMFDKLKKEYDPYLKSLQHTFRKNFPKTWN